MINICKGFLESLSICPRLQAHMYWLKKQPGFTDKFPIDTRETSPDQLIVRLKGTQEK